MPASALAAASPSFPGSGAGRRTRVSKYSGRLGSRCAARRRAVTALRAAARLWRRAAPRVKADRASSAVSSPARYRKSRRRSSSSRSGSAALCSPGDLAGHFGQRAFADAVQPGGPACRPVKAARASSQWSGAAARKSSMVANARNSSCSFLAPSPVRGGSGIRGERPLSSSEYPPLTGEGARNEREGNSSRKSRATTARVAVTLRFVAGQSAGENGVQCGRGVRDGRTLKGGWGRFQRPASRQRGLWTWGPETGGGLPASRIKSTPTAQMSDCRSDCSSG